MPHLQPKPWLNEVASEPDGWLAKLATWYEGDWQKAIVSGSLDDSAFPQVDSFVETLEPEKRESAINTLRTIDQYYRATLEDPEAITELRDILSHNGDMDATFLGDAPANPSNASDVSKASKFTQLNSQPEPLHYDLPTIETDAETAAKVSRGPGGATENAPDELDQTIEGQFDLTAGSKVKAGAAAGKDAGNDIGATGDFSVGAVERGGGARIYSGKKTKAGTSALATGQMIDDYRVEGVLGEGGMGIVYLATDTKLNRMVALKMILGDLDGRQIVRDRFEAEAKAVAKFQHENIVRIFQIGEIKSGRYENSPYIALEFIEGDTLSARLKQNPCSPKDSAKLLEPIARGLHFAHEQNIIHRDMKPANVLLTEDGVPKISDFGLAREIEADQSLSISGTVVGTPGYMAPEQARAATNIDGRADVYALGAMLYAMLTGRPPLLGSNPGESISMLLTEEPVSPARLRPGMHKDIETICLKCLEKEPDNRYATAELLADDLGRFHRGEVISARPVPIWVRAGRWMARNPKTAGAYGLAASLALILSIGGPIAAVTINAQKEQVEKTNVALAESEEQERVARQKAETNEELAKQNEQRAVASEEVAVAAKAEAVQSAKSAQAGYKQALDAMKSLVFGVIRKLEDRPGMADVREELLATAREGLQRLDSTAKDPTQNNIVAAGTLRRLGDLNLQTGRIEAARQCYDRCLEIVTKIDGEGNLPGRFHNLSTAHDLLGQSLRAQGNMEAAKDQFTKALELRRAWYQAEPNKPGVLDNVAATLGRLAYTEMDLGDLAAAEKWFDESAAIRKDAAKENTFSLGPKMEWLGSKWSLEKLRFRQGDLQTAVTNLAPIAKELETLAEENPFLLAPSWNSGLAHAELAQWQLYQGNKPAAETAIEQSIERLREIVKTEPKNLRLADTLANSLYFKAIIVDEGAKKLLDECIAIRKKVLESDPELGIGQLRLAMALARAGETDSAQTIIDGIQSPTKAHAGWWHTLAVAHAQLASALSDDDEKKSALIAKGVQAIVQGQQAGQMYDIIIRLDPELEPLRNSSQWQAKVDAKTAQVN